MEFCDGLMAHFEIITSCVVETDEALSATVRLAYRLMMELIGSAHRVSWKLQAVAGNSYDKLTLSLHEMTRCRAVFQGTMAEINDSMVALGDDIEAVRCKYMDLLEQVGSCDWVFVKVAER